MIFHSHANKTLSRIGEKMDKMLAFIEIGNYSSIEDKYGEETNPDPKRSKALDDLIHIQDTVGQYKIPRGRAGDRFNDMIQELDKLQKAINNEGSDADAEWSDKER